MFIYGGRNRYGAKLCNIFVWQYDVTHSVHCVFLLGGRNGYGAKLCNIFSTKFIVETSSHDYKRAFKQVHWRVVNAKNCQCNYTPRKRSLGGYIGITPSVRPSVRLSVQSKLNLGYNFSTNRDKAFILHMLVPCDKTFLSIPKILTLWPWPWLLTYFWKNLTLAITFEPKVIVLQYCTYLFPVTRPL